MKVFVLSRWLALLLLFVPISILKPQTAHQNHPWWVNLGAGPSLVGSDFSMNGGMVYCYQFENSIISGRIIGLTNINPTVQKIDPTSIKYKMSDYGILYGPIWQSEYSYISIGVGIGLVRAAYIKPEYTETNTSISLPLEVQWFWRPVDFAGVGIYAYTSLNFEKMLYGVMFCAQLGVW